MNYIKHLTGFFDRIIPDRNLNPTHISLYIALFQFWNINRFQNPISITRDEVMRICKISSKATYHKCMKDLNDKGYVKYEPSFNPYKGSMVTLFDFSAYLKPVQKKDTSTQKILSKNEQVLNKQRTASETSTDTSIEQALVSSINNTNITNNSNIKNNLNLEEQAKNLEDEHVFAWNVAIAEKKEEEKKLREKKKNKTENSNLSSRARHLERSRETRELSSSIAEVRTYFLQQNFPELEANKFFNYFSSVGWLIGGKIPMVDWQAAAQNWMLNTTKFKSLEKPPDRAKHLNIGTDKDYSEPL
jgi:hypothetical protein